MNAKNNEKIRVAITMPIEIAETLYDLIDAALGAADDDNFINKMKPLRKALKQSLKNSYLKL